MNDFIQCIGNEQIKNLLNINAIVKICEYVFSNLEKNTVCSPKKFSMPLPGNSSINTSWINSMPAYLINENVAGIKWVSVCSKNRKHNLPTTNGVIILNDLETGMPFAVLEASLITHLRTAASIVLAAKQFAPSQAQVATLIGPGQEGMYATLFLQQEYNFRKINVISRSESSFLKFKNFMNQKVAMPPEVIRVTRSSGIFSESDIILASSTSMKPILDSSCFRKKYNKDQFICGLTAFNDISTSILKHIDNVIFDDGKNAQHRIEYVSNIQFSELNLKNILSMNCPSKAANNTGVNLYLPIGISAMDIAIANYFYNRVYSDKKIQLHKAVNL